MNDLLSPAEVLVTPRWRIVCRAPRGVWRWRTDEAPGGAGARRWTWRTRRRDYIPPELVTLFLTDAGGVPGFIPSLLEGLLAAGG